MDSYWIPQHRKLPLAPDVKKMISKKKIMEKYGAETEEGQLQHEITNASGVDEVCPLVSCMKYWIVIFGWTD